MRDMNRLTAAFADLEAQGVLTFQNFWCCGGCSAGGVWQAHEKNSAAVQARTIGAVWYHEQDAENALEGHGLSLRHGALPSGDSDERTIHVARLVVAALTAHGLAPDWGGDPRKVIEIPHFKVTLGEIPDGEGSSLHETYGADLDDDDSDEEW